MKARSPVSLRGLRTFCVAGKHESFTAAAEELFITPSAVSHQIKSLEKELGLRLFDRSARDLKLTGTGRSMYAEILPLIDEIDTIVGSYRSQTQRSAIRMSVQPFFASELFLPRLGSFTERYPHIEIQVAASDESRETHPADVDLAIRLFREPPPGFESRELFPLRLVPAGNREMSEALRVKDGSIVGDFPVIVHESYPKAWQQWSRVSGIEIPEGGKVTRLDSMIAVVRAAEQGIGAALVPIPIAEQWFRQGTITRLFDDELLADVSYFLIWQPVRSRQDSVALLRDWILETFSLVD